MTERHNIHATGLCLGEVGLMLRGSSGAGKSLLALALLDAAETRGEPAWLVADDRLELAATAEGIIIMHAPPAIAGLVELRGRGIVARPYRECAVLHVVVDLVPQVERMPEPDEFVTEVLGVTLARCPVPAIATAGIGHALLLVGETLRQVSAGKSARVKKSLE